MPPKCDKNMYPYIEMIRFYKKWKSFRALMFLGAGKCFWTPLRAGKCFWMRTSVVKIYPPIMHNSFRIAWRFTIFNIKHKHFSCKLICILVEKKAKHFLGFNKCRNGFVKWFSDCTPCASLQIIDIQLVNEYPWNYFIPISYHIILHLI